MTWFSVEVPGTLASAGDRLIGPRGSAVVTATAGWYPVGFVGLLLDSDLATVDHYLPVLVLSSAALLFGVWVFWRHGGTTITSVGIYNLAFALFVGFAGLHLLFSGAAQGSVVRALAWCYFGHVTTWLLFWANSPPPPDLSGPRPVAPAFLRRVSWVGVLITCGAVVPSLELVGSLRQVGQAAGFVGAVLIAIGLLSDERRPPLLGCLLAMGGLLLSIATSNSFGRLMLGSLGLALLVVASRRLRTRLVKAVVIASSAPILLLFAELRLDAVRANLPDAQITGTGLESVASPLRTFGVLLDYNDVGSLAYAWGHTFWVALISLVPRSVWPTKPPGFGAELMLMLHPELASSGHSDAALIQGEWLYNFGIVGLVLAVPVTGLVVQAADRFLAKAAARPLVGRNALLVYATAIILSAGLPDLFWGGTFTFAVRGGMRLAVLMGAWLLLAGREDRMTLPGMTNVQQDSNGVLPAVLASRLPPPGRSAAALGR